MADEAESRSRRTLIIAAVVAGLCSLALVVLGWWFRDWEHSTDRQRFEDGSWWAGVVSQVLGYLALGKIGFKLALGGVVAAVSLSAWARGSQRRHEPTDDHTLAPHSEGREADGSLDPPRSSRTGSPEFVVGGLGRDPVAR
ncbi:hypothetical protein [Micromonospora sp. CPCC 206061]|uniref:hypothetical protein n=1 Tax=Micromonospora sp. CPCC 206061 TaxID=3122410 RepID=UPI002FF1DC19